MFFFAGAYYLILYYLPIYFQSIDDASSIGSGVRNLPLIIAVTFATIISGGSITATGLGSQIQLGFTCIALIAAGLLYTLNSNTSTGKWIGYQILAGVGYGGAFQVLMIIAQATSKIEDLAEVTAITLCT
jgi:hypothetical protein